MTHIYIWILITENFYEYIMCVVQNSLKLHYQHYNTIPLSWLVSNFTNITAIVLSYYFANGKCITHTVQWHKRKFKIDVIMNFICTRNLLPYINFHFISFLFYFNFISFIFNFSFTFDCSVKLYYLFILHIFYIFFCPLLYIYERFF